MPSIVGAVPPEGIRIIHTRLKIAYLCETSPDKLWSHSGGNTRIFNALQAHVGDVTPLEVSWGTVDFVRRTIDSLPTEFLIRLRFRAHLLLAPLIGREVARQLALDEYDVLFCAYGFFCLAGVKLPYPMLSVFTSDASFTAYKYSEVGEAFGSFFTPSRLLDAWILRKERSVFCRLDLCLWPSEWMANKARAVYGVREGDNLVIKWGANIDPPAPTEFDLNLAFGDTVRLLFVGRDWVPKGGPLVAEVLKTLLAKGIDAQLTIVGCEVPENEVHGRMEVFRQLNKSDPEELAKLKALYRDSHFFVLASFEAYGFAFCEASAYALPSLSLRVGGVPISEGENGHGLPADSGPEAFAELIIKYIGDPAAYGALRASTRLYYEQHLNWDAWGEKVSAILHERLESRSAMA